MKVENIARIASDTAQERLHALNFEKVVLDTPATFYKHLRIPGTNDIDNDIVKNKSKSALLMLPHYVANDGLWSNDLCATTTLEFCTVLPHVEQQLMLSNASIFIISPIPQVSLRDNLAGSLECVLLHRPAFNLPP